MPISSSTMIPYDDNIGKPFNPLNSPPNNKTNKAKEKHDLYGSYETEHQSPVKSKKRQPLCPLTPQGKVNRKVIQYYNIPQNTPLKSIVEVPDVVALKILESHAKGRVIMFAVAAIALHDLAVRSNPETLRNVRLNIGSAWEQMGQASKGKHAAHMNAGAGLIDNIEKLVIDEIINEKGVTPKKTKLMLTKGFTSEDIELMKKNNFDIDTVKDIFNVRWPLLPNKPSSVLNGTRISDTLNLTNQLDAHTNLTCDKGLERRIRDIIISLYHNVIQGYMTVEEATKSYCENVVTHFKLVIEQLEIYSPIIRDYETAFAKLYEVDNTGKNRLRDLTPDKFYKHLTKLNSAFDEVLKYQIEDDKDKPAEKMQKTKKQFHVEVLGMNKKFIKQVKAYLNHTIGLEQVKHYLNLCGERLHKEITNRIEHVDEYLVEAKWELKGTIVPEMEEIYKQLMEDYNVESTENFDAPDLQLRMLEQKVRQGPEGDLSGYIQEKRKQHDYVNSRPKRQRISPVALPILQSFSSSSDTGN